MHQSFTKKELEFLSKINTPAKIQDLLNSLRFNFERDGKTTIKSPLLTLRTKSAHCLEGAILGAYLLSRQGFKPYLLHLEASKEDFDHVVAPFKVRGLWGAISKTNHAVLRYREPVYRSIRELVMSYFHEYFLDNGKKTLRRYSRLLDLNVFKDDWTTGEEDLWGIDEELDKIKHYEILPKNSSLKLRKADEVEIRSGKIVEFRK